MKHSADEAIVKEKMKQTFTYCQKMLHDPVKSSEIFTAFSRFLDIPGMIEQDFNLLFGDVTSAKFLEKWPTVYKKKVLDQSRGLTQTGDLQTGTSIQGHLDSIMESRQPYLVAVGTQRSVIHKYFIVIDKHAIPCKSPDCIDELFKAHFVFGTSYNQDLVNVYNFLQTTIYEIDVENTKVNPRVAELRARMLN
ncbi:hypothetical protein JOQ06_010570 [Pogonophryne albipinna]|uniref:Uncharacterized protein n=1 Tax=Pogonophryne albipinna TaxID=1090488 RepID=A0AAD6AW40_9TELE|nr:hypothetical protein JOQ06_010570 [Pogonophryne albipinna]